jgi:hypothetical protein
MIKETENKPASANLVTEGKSFLAAFCSKEPVSSIDQSLKSNSFIWAILLAAFVVFGALGTLLIPMNFMRITSGEAWKMMSAAFPGWKLLGSGLLLFAIYGGVFIVGLKIVLVLYKASGSFIDILKSVGAAFFPMVAALIVAIIFSFFLYQASMLVLVFGGIVSTLLLYASFKKFLGKDDVVWAFAIVFTLAVAIVFLVAGSLMKDVMQTLVGGAVMGGLKQAGNSVKMPDMSSLGL